MNQRVHHHWNETERDYSRARNPHELIVEQVSRTPDASALIIGEERLSYRELNDRANQLAHFLRAQKIGPDRLVGVCLNRSPDMVVAFLAILKAGGAYIPLDPKFPKRRIEFMLSDADVSVLLTERSMQDLLPETNARLVFMDEADKELSALPKVNLPAIGRPEHLAYVIYTSGSTGNPKGVMIPRSALTNFLYSMIESPGLSPADTFLAITTISFDISILEFLLPLAVGASVVIATREQAADGRELHRLLDLHRVTVMQATPTTWRMLLDAGWSGKTDLKIFSGGEPLGSDLARRLLPRCVELWNLYGPTEATIWSSAQRVTSPDHLFLNPLVANTQFYVVDDQLRPVQPGSSGELLIGGAGLARGYLKRPELTAEKFIPNPFSAVPGSRLYRSGDEVRFREDGNLECLGRLDHQVKLHGFRIELGEIESALGRIEGIRQAVVVMREDRPGDRRLVAYYTSDKDLSSTTMLQALKNSLPEYMVPSVFMRLEQFPVTPNAKLDRKALPAPGGKRPLLAQDYIAPRTALEKQLAERWRELLNLDAVGVDDSFFDLGGTSVLAVGMVNLCHSRYGYEIPLVKVFQYPTIAQLCRFLEGKESNPSIVTDAEHREARKRGNTSAKDPEHGAVAVVGMVGRFPGADNLRQLWLNLRNSVESISFFAPEELSPGIEEHLRRDPDYIRARGLIDGVDMFDAAFFGISPLEAKVMDPQQRVFLELAQHALENAGYDPDRFKGLIGVYAGIGDNHYYTTNLLTHPDLLAMAGKLAVEYGNQKDYIALRTAYLLDLRGPAVSLNTACSTTLLAIDQAYRALLDYECDMALAGGIDITIPHRSGFLYQEGGTFAKDGHCRPFDAEATGTMFCDGAGIVVLKRLDDALAGGDTVYAVLRGTGKNNNGARPASFLAPSVDGQAEAIAMAQARANVPIETIRYIEAHGTGTPVGDPIEIEALTKVFQAKTSKKQFCFVGSIKGNIGHPTNAAGVAGLIKAALVLHHEEIPPTLHFRKSNPKIDFTNSPFVIADKLIPFPRGAEARRAAVSSFGFGGTNVHAILEEAPLPRPGSGSRPMQLIPISAKTPTALDAYGRSLADYFAGAPQNCFADAAFTLQTGRRQMAQRRFVVAADPREAAQLLREPNPLRCSGKRCDRRNPPLVFLFGGQGTQYVNMGRNLYEGEPLFRAIVDHCCEFLKPHLGRDLRELLYPQAGDEETAKISLQDTFFTQPSIFVIEYALASFWRSLGIQPSIMAGHSIGEFVAGTLASVWDLEDALRIIALRGRLMQSLPRGAMMAVSSSVEKVGPILPASVQVASNNSPSLCVVSGPEADVSELQDRLEAQGIVCRRLHTSHAFHSSMMDPMVEGLRSEVAKVRLRAPAMNFVSTVTGRMITAAETTSPAYWAHHARATVEFSKAVQTLREQGHDLFLECGPRSTLCSLTRQHFSPDRPCTAIPSLSDSHENNAEWASLLFALGSLWQNGISVDWDAFHAHEDRRRVPLPCYPFERKSYWVDPAATVATALESTEPIPAAHAGPGDTEFAAAAELSQAAAGTAETRRERLVARLVDVLVPVSGRERSLISTSSTFLEQGFDSLSLTQVALAIRKEFGVKVTFGQLMNQFPNVEMVASHLDQTMPADRSAAIQPKRPVATTSSAATPSSSPQPKPPCGTREETVTNEPCIANRLGQSPAAIVAVESTVPQRGIYYSSGLSDHLSASYNESVTVRFTGTISVPKLTRAIERLVERHDALRASFDETGSVMRIAPSLRTKVPVTDISSLASAQERENRLRGMIAEESARVFSLPAGPLFRAQIVRLDADSAAVLLTGHHIICDGWSLDVLIHDLCAFYSEELSGAPAELRPTSSFAEYAREVVRRDQSAEFDQARDYWHAKFAGGFHALVLPSNRPRSARREYTARRLDGTVPSALVRKIRSLAAEQNASLFSVIVGALSILLARVSRQKRFVLPLPTAEQPVIGKPDLVGHCVNLLPFLVEFHNGESVSAFLARVQRDLSSGHEHTAFTLVSLLEELRCAAPASGVSHVSAGLTSVRTFTPGELPQSGFSVEYQANAKAFESFEWYLNAIEDGDVLHFHCHYDTGLFDEAAMEEWLAVLNAILTDMAEDPSREALALASLKRTDTRATSEVVYSLLSTQISADRGLVEVRTSPRKALDREERWSSTRENESLCKTLQGLWSRVLNVRMAEPDDDFFALGGQSMIAAQLFALIKAELGLSAPLSVLYEAPTPRTLAAKLSREGYQKAWQSLVTINSSGNRPPLFLVHAAEGNVLLYRSLAAYLGEDQPVYGLQSAGLDGRSEIDGRFENVACRYAREIRQVQPHGPYMLGGYCLGGTIAMEIARQLIEAGETVGLLAMFENFNIRAIRWPLPLHLRLMNAGFLNLYYHALNFLGAEGDDKLAFFTQKLHVEMTRARVYARVALARAWRRLRPNAPTQFPHIKVADVYDGALEQYDVKPYPGEITLFLAKRHLAGMGDRLGGWGNVAQGGVRLYSLPISPKGSLVEPYVRQLAAMLRGCLDEALKESRAENELIAEPTSARE